MTGQLCPECGTPRTAGGGPGCGCKAIRKEPAEARRPDAETQGARPAEAQAQPDAETTMVLRAVVPGVVPPVAGAGASGKASAAGAGAAAAPSAKAAGTGAQAAEAAGAGTAEATATRVGAEGNAAAEAEAARQAGLQRAAAEEIAEAEDFNPLRVRPYVTLDADDDSAGPPPAFRTAGPMPPLAPAAGSPVPPPASFYPAPPTPRRKRYRALVIGAAALAVIGTAAFAGGLFSRDEPAEQALPEQTRDRPTVGAAEPSGPSRSLASPTRSASPTPSATPSVTPTFSEVPPAADPPPASAPRPSSTPPKTPSSQPPPPPRRPSQASQGGSLGPGDSGPEVVELQYRLQEVWLFRGQADGQYDDRVERAVHIYQSYKSIEGDPEGVYGPNTRRALEAETRGHGRRN
ncbi:peptidoglycan-binding protein [Streptomyces sp. NPDC001840]